MPVRSISHAPDSIKPASHGAVLAADSEPAWILCRNRYAFPVRDTRALQHLAEDGRVRPDDFLFSPRLDVCVRARDLAELKASLRKAMIRRVEKISSTVASVMSRLWL